MRDAECGVRRVGTLRPGTPEQTSAAGDMIRCLIESSAERADRATEQQRAHGQYGGAGGGGGFGGVAAGACIGLLFIENTAEVHQG